MSWRAFTLGLFMIGCFTISHFRGWPAFGEGYSCPLNLESSATESASISRILGPISQNIRIVGCFFCGCMMGDFFIESSKLFYSNYDVLGIFILL